MPDYAAIITVTTTPVALPSYAHIAELRLSVRPMGYGPKSILTRRHKQTPKRSEAWQGSIVLAPMLPADARTLAAFLHSLDGPVTPFSFSLKGGFARPATAAVLTCPSCVEGSTTIGLVCVAGQTYVEAGTMINVYFDDTKWQLLEVTEGVVVGTSSTPVPVAPRVRVGGISPFVESLNPVARVRLTEELQPDFRVAIGRGYATLSVIEAI